VIRTPCPVEDMFIKVGANSKTCTKNLGLILKSRMLSLQLRWLSGKV
jgi:hypothetical protein